jgi:mannose-6-phosphate isomerase-like protein (cupin superfamily)
MQSTNTEHQYVVADWANRGFSCELWVDAPDQVWKDFEHDVDELLLLLEGNCQIELEDRTFRMEVGKEVIIPAGTRYTARNCGKGRARLLHGYPTT